MPLSLYVDGQKWRSHLSAMVSAKPGLVPVIKGNGYGFGLAFLGAESSRLGVSAVAVGLASEVAPVRSAFSGEIIVLSPDNASYDFSDSKVIWTISSLENLEAIGSQSKIIIEILTPLNRHGIKISDLDSALAIVENRGLAVQGFTLHLPIVKIDVNWIRKTLQKLPTTSTVWISHLYDLEKIQKEFPQLIFRERIGTSLWLGNQSALAAKATVLENREVKGAAGYRQTRANGYVVVASGGTAHGIGLAAPQGDKSLLGGLKIVARAIESALGKDRSPYSWNGKTLNFLEPAHMQCSLLKIEGQNQPKIGDELNLRVRYTTTTFDQIVVR